MFTINRVCNYCKLSLEIIISSLYDLSILSISFNDFKMVKTFLNHTSCAENISRKMVART